MGACTAVHERKGVRGAGPRLRYSLAALNGPCWPDDYGSCQPITTDRATPPINPWAIAPARMTNSCLSLGSMCSSPGLLIRPSTEPFGSRLPAPAPVRRSTPWLHGRVGALAALAAVRSQGFGRLAAEEHGRLSRTAKGKAALPGPQLEDCWVVTGAAGGVVLHHLGVGDEGCSRWRGRIL